MYSNNAELSHKISELGVVESAFFTDAAVLGGAFTATEQPFTAFLSSFGWNDVSGDRWSGDDWGIFRLGKTSELIVSIVADADEMIFAEIIADGVDSDSRMVFDEVDFSDNPGDAKTVNFYSSDKVYRLVTSRAQGARATRQILLRLEDKDSGNPAPQSDWTVFKISIWKTVFS